MEMRKINYEKFVLKSVSFLENYIKKNNLMSLVLGISGGLDSTVTAAIASIACRRCGIDLIGRSLPCSTNTNGEVNSANLTGKAFCTDYKEVSLESLYGNVMSTIENEEEYMNNIQKGNVKARLRMIYLYNLASANHGCVLDTDNLTEHKLGFWTIHGDVGDLNIGICHLWKTEVYELAFYLRNLYDKEYTEPKPTPNETAEGLIIDDEKIRLMETNEAKRLALDVAINLVPTDGNGVSSSDCEQFGMENYVQVDMVLQGREEEYRKSCPERGIRKVLELNKKTEYKRKQMPIKPDIDNFV